MSELQMLSLGELCEKITDGTHHSPVNLPEGTYKYITAKNIKPWGIDLTSVTYVDEKTHREIYARCDVKKGDVLYVKDGATTGVAAINSLDEEFSLLSSVGVLRPGHAITSKYLLYALQEPKTRQAMLDEVSGVAITRLTLAKLKATEIPVAPLPEQARIVAKLDELLSDLDAGVAELEAAQRKLQRYRQSLLRAVVEGRLIQEEDYALTTLQDVVTEIGQGWSPKCEREASGGSGWAVMKTTAIQPMAFDGSHCKALPTDLAPRPHLEIASGDLLITRAGPRSRVGVACLVRHTQPKLMLCDKAYRLRCNEELIRPEFLELVLNSPDHLRQIDEMKSGISDSGVNLTQSRFLALSIPLPPLATQARIVKLMSDTENAIREKLSSIERGLAQSVAQRQNLLRAAFRGELVPQDPRDEPASVLLERLRAERGAPSRPVQMAKKKRLAGERA